MKADPKSIKQLKNLLHNHQEVLAAYIFGSRAKEQALPGSDLDLGLVIEDPKKLDYGQLYAEISRLFPNPKQPPFLFSSS